MADHYSDDWIDGRRVPPLVITQDYVLTGTHVGSVHVELGDFTLAGVLQGSLSIDQDVEARVAGCQQGSVSAAAGSTITVDGAIQGSVHVEPGAKVVVEPSGTIAGSLHNDGLVIVRGIFGGSQSGTGELRVEGKGYIKQPEIRDGVYYYRW